MHCNKVRGSCELLDSSGTLVVIEHPPAMAFVAFALSAILDYLDVGARRRLGYANSSLTREKMTLLRYRLNSPALAAAGLHPWFSIVRRFGPSLSYCVDTSALDDEGWIDFKICMDIAWHSHRPGHAINHVTSMQVRTKRQLSWRRVGSIMWPRQLRKLCLFVDMEAGVLDMFDWQHLLDCLPRGLRTLQISLAKNYCGVLGVEMLTEYFARTEAMPEWISYVQVRLSWTTRHRAELLCQELQLLCCSGEVTVDVEGRRELHFVW
jgi:hypothetical protein